jgi:undecaprenyl-diphosphatase
MLNFQIFISQISGPEIMFTLVIILAIALYKKHDNKDFYTMLFTSTTAMFVTYSLKYLLKVPRPEDMIIAANDYRFPSGHATMAAVIMSLGIYYTNLHIKHKPMKYTLFLCAIMWYVLVSYSRLYLQVHYPIDIIVGGSIGIASTIITLKIFKHLHYYK